MSGKAQSFLAICLLAVVSIAAIIISDSKMGTHGIETIRNFAMMNQTRLMSLNVQAQPPPARRCKAHTHVAYIKTHKTGSTTLESIFNRFGFFHNSSFIFNKRDPYGHFEALDLHDDAAEKYFLPPLGVQAGDYARYRNYDAFAVHARFYKDAFDWYMAKDMRYVTSVRDPADQWESAFNQFGFRKAISTIAGAEQMLVINDSIKVPFNDANSTLDAINEFLRAPELYHNKIKTSMKNIIWHFAHNDQMFDLSTNLEMEELHNETLVNQTIDRLVRELDVIIVNEYFDESLLVMKKALCWDFTDILYISKNKRSEKVILPEETRAKIRGWNHADTLLHSHFNDTLWKKIKDYGPDFETDLKQFRQMLSEVKSNCSADGDGTHKHGYNYSIFATNAKPNSSLFCKVIANGYTYVFEKVFNRQKYSGSI